MTDTQMESPTDVRVERMVMPPVLERWECFRMGHINTLAADYEQKQAVEWRERAAKRGVRWQNQLAIAIRHERMARQRYARAREWREYAKTVAA